MRITRMDTSLFVGDLTALALPPGRRAAGMCSHAAPTTPAMCALLCACRSAAAIVGFPFHNQPAAYL